MNSVSLLHEYVLKVRLHRHDCTLKYFEQCNQTGNKQWKIGIAHQFENATTADLSGQEPICDFTGSLESKLEWK